MERLGVIDLGTNTFHLLIVEPLAGGGFRELYRERRFIKLAEGGIHTIDAAAFRRGLAALREYREVLSEYGVGQAKAFGTAALRTADNGAEFIRQAEAETGIRVQLISGQEEARLIHLGVAQAVPFTLDKALIMDIGGGSVEFIIADKERVFWAESFPVGVAVLRARFHRHEPIQPAEIEAIERLLDQVLQPLSDALQTHEVHSLVGASGTFEVLESLLIRHKEHPLHAIFPVEQFFPLYEHIVSADEEERLRMEGIPESRVDMIVVALVLLRYVVRLAGIRQITVSAYALKEGMLAEMISGK